MSSGYGKNEIDNNKHHSLPKFVDINLIQDVYKKEMGFNTHTVVRCPWANSDEIFQEKQVAIVRMGLKES